MTYTATEEHAEKRGVSLAKAAFSDTDYIMSDPRILATSMQSWWRDIDRYGCRQYFTLDEACSSPQDEEKQSFQIFDPLPSDFSRASSTDEGEEDSEVEVTEGEVRLNLSCSWRGGRRHGCGVLSGEFFEQKGIR